MFGFASVLDQGMYKLLEYFRKSIFSDKSYLFKAKVDLACWQIGVKINFKPLISLMPVLLSSEQQTSSHSHFVFAKTFRPHF